MSDVPVTPPPSTEPVAGTMTPTIVQRAGKIATWTRIVGVSSFTGGALILIGGIFLAGTAHATGKARAILLGVAMLYLIMAAIAITIGVILLRFGEQMKIASKQRRGVPLAAGLGYETAYWRIAGILTLLTFAASLINSAVPAIRGGIMHSQGKRTVRDIETIGAALESYAAKHHQYPSSTSIDQLAVVLAPKYTKRLPLRDGWDRPFDYTPLPKNSIVVSYRLTSAGADGTYDTSDESKTDYIHSDGHWVSKPGAKPKP